MRSRIAASFVLLLVVLAAACGSGSPTEPSPPNNPPPSTPPPASPFSLSGQWERFNSSFPALNGMVAEVNAEETQGVITSTPSNTYQFQAGDLKWKDVVKLSDTEYTFEDLVRQANTGAQSYVPGVIEVLDGGEELRFRFPTTGTSQRWRRP